MNIIKSLKKELEKGNTMVTLSGEVVSPEKHRTLCEKEYLALAKEGRIDIEAMSFSDFIALDKIDVLYVDELIKYISSVSETETLSTYPTNEAEAEGEAEVEGNEEGN